MLIGKGVMDDKEEEQNSISENRSSNHKADVVTVAAFLLGMKDEFLKSERSPYDQELVRKLELNSSAKDMRCLTMLRQQIMQNCKKISTKRKAEFPYSLDAAGLSDLINTQDIEYLKNRNMDIIIPRNNNLMYNIALINQYILDRVGNLKGLFYDWINFDYIKALFIMPGCNADRKLLASRGQEFSDRINGVRSEYYENFMKYPFNMFLVWPKPFDDNGEGGNAAGNIMGNDFWFLKQLYEANGDKFTKSNYVIDASEGTKQIVYDFVSEATNILVVVDCENASPYSLAGCLLNLDPEQIGKVKRIKLINDVHTSTAWDRFQEMLAQDGRNIEVEIIPTTRVKEEKSLVDMIMAVEICKDHHVNSVDSVILVSSDSDFWGVIERLSSARFLVLNERMLTSQKIIENLNQYSIAHCFMDMFAQDERVQKFKQDVLYGLLRNKIEEFNATGEWGKDFLNVDYLVSDFFKRAYIKGAEEQMKCERDAFKNKYFKNGFVLGIVSNSEGEDVLSLDSYRRN